MLAGSILAGRTLIDAAAIRAQVTQIEGFQTATNTFREKYGYLPGDIKDPDASRFGFGARGTYGGGGQGDGDGVIIGYMPTCCADDFILVAGESPVFWVDLSTAKLVKGAFSAASLTTAPPTVTESTTPPLSSFLPAAAIGQGNYIYVYSGGSFCASNCFGLAAITLLASNNSAGQSGPGITVAQAYSIDTKIDDGKPTLGNVVADYVNPDSYGGHATPPNGPPSSGTCYDNSATPNPYSIKVANNTGRNCAISFLFK